MDMTLFSLSFSLFLLMDALGNVPIFIAVLKEMKPSRQRSIILRELILALFIIILFYFLGGPLLTFLRISQQAVLISGGVILFLIALKMIFSNQEKDNWSFGREPFLVPLAIPLVAGPAVLSAVMLYSHEQIPRFVAIGAILIAWTASTIILVCSTYLKKVLGERGINACEKLMGLLLIMLSVEMFLDGLRRIFQY